MAISWKKYHVGLTEKGKLFIGYGGVKNHQIKWEQTSDDRTEEIIRAVIEKFRSDRMAKLRRGVDRPYAGCKIDGVGTLVFIEKGWDFSVKPEPRKKK